jgi:chaperone protein EcpD
MIKLNVTSWLFAGLMLASSTAFAGIQVNTTRVVYPLGARSVTVNVVNKDASPRLIKVWVERDGASSDAGGDADVPFVVTPPLSRVEADGGQALRLAHVGPPPPMDRESVYWLNVLDIPPDRGSSSENVLQFAMRTRLKIFLRPKGLEGSPEKAVEGLVWRKVIEKSETFLECSNPSAFHLSLVDITLPGQEAMRGEMIAPRGVHRFKVAAPAALAAGTGMEASMRTVNDYGALITGRFHLTAGN